MPTSNDQQLSWDDTLTPPVKWDWPHLRAASGGTYVGRRPLLNFISGTGATVTVADDSVNDRINVTVSASVPSASSSVVSETGWGQSASAGSSSSYSRGDHTHGTPSDPWGFNASKGALVVYNGSAWTVLSAGTNEHFLCCNDTTATGLEWVALP